MSGLDQDHSGGHPDRLVGRLSPGAEETPVTGRHAAFRTLYAGPMPMRLSMGLP